MKLVRDARTLKTKAIESLRTAMTGFNSYDDAGRITTVLMHAQHACEMLLKAVLVQGKAKVFDKDSGRSIGFEKCLGRVDKVDSQISGSVIQDCLLGGSFGSRRPDGYGMADH